MNTTSPAIASVQVELPPQWELARDLFLLIGRGAEAMAHGLAQAGQERLIVVLPQEAEPGPLPDRARVVRNQTELFQAILSLHGGLPQHVRLHRTPDPWVSVERHRELASWVAEALSSKRLQKQTIENMGAEWLQNGIGNLPEVAARPSIAALQHAFAGRPCVIVSPGPSLSRNLHLLRELQGRALILSGTHSLHALAHAGVTPDFVLACDAGDLQRHYQGLELDPPPAMCIEATARRENFRLPTERAFTFTSNGQIDDWIFGCVSEQAHLPTGGSVSCSAMSLALWLGCEPIALCGQDLSFPDGKYYAEESLDGSVRVEPDQEGGYMLVKPRGSTGIGAPLPDGQLRFTRPRNVVHAPGYHGGTVPSSEALNAFRIWFEALAAVTPTRLWNCTEGGAHIQGLEHVPLQKALDEWPRERIDVRGVLERVSQVDLEARRGIFLRVTRERLAALETCAELARQCEQLVTRAARDRHALARLQELEQELGRALAPVRFLSLHAQREIEAAQEKARVAQDLARNLEAARELFRVVRTSAARLRPPLQGALDELAG